MPLTNNKSRLSVGKKIHKDKTNNGIVFIEENEVGTQSQNKFTVYWNTVERFRCCYEIIFIVYAKDLGQWGCSRFPRKLKLSPNSHREVQTAPARLRETQTPAKHSVVRAGVDELTWNCLVWIHISGRALKYVPVLTKPGSTSGAVKQGAARGRECISGRQRFPRFPSLFPGSEGHIPKSSLLPINSTAWALRVCISFRRWKRKFPLFWGGVKLPWE